MPRRTTRDVIVLVRGFVQAVAETRFHAGGTVTLITGTPHILVDSGGAEQRQDILDAFNARDLKLADVGYVVMTHGHLDHIGNNNLFPHATFVLDTDVSRDGEYWTHSFADGPLVIESPEHDAPVTVMATPGHTDHDVSVFVATDGGTVAIVGDLFEYEGDDVDNAWRRWSRNPEQQQASRDKVLALADAIVPGHGDIFKVR